MTVTAGNPDPNSEVIERERRRLSQRLEEVARLCEADINPPTFYGELLKRLLESLAAPAGAVWTRTAQGNLQLQFQINLKEVGLDRTEEARQSARGTVAAGRHQAAADAPAAAQRRRASRRRASRRRATRPTSSCSSCPSC